MNETGTGTKTRHVHVRIPDRLVDPLDRATERLMLPTSAYVRQALFEKLKADGFMPERSNQRAVSI